MYRWNASDYARHSAGQEQWARELLAGAAIVPDDRVLDVGCGDGRITAGIAISTKSPLDADGRVHVKMLRLQVEARRAQHPS